MDNAKEFFAAIRAGDAATARTMLEAEPALATAKNEQGQSPVLAAVYGGRADVRDLLIAHGAHLEFYEAVAAGQLESVEHFVEKDPDLARSFSPDGFPVIALNPRDSSYDRMMGNLEEVRAREGRVISIGHEGDRELRAKSDIMLTVPPAGDLLTPMLLSIPLQLLAYHMAVRLGRDVDQPRNLAKSVTVE